jgi:steroid 5-alpha reductase family enzyme
MTLEQVFLANLLAIAMAVTALWGVSLLRRDASIIDSFWGLGFVLVAWNSLNISGVSSPRTLLLVLLISVWGLRLSSYLAWRNLGKPEDYRYAAMREHHGKRFPLVSLLTVFVLQGALMWIISLPFQVGIVRIQEWNVLATVGVVLYAVGVFFEAVGDYQLARFKANPGNKGRVMDKGLWRYTRHPNYFGDFLVWWGFYLLAAEPRSWW